MKKVLLLASLMGLFVLGCQKNDPVGEEISVDNLKLMDDENLSASIDEDVVKFADLYTAFDGMSLLKSAEIEACPVVTKESPKDKRFPMTITLDFGAGCTAVDGKLKSGKMIVVKSGPWTEVGATRKITFDNFMVDGVKIEGEKKATHENIAEDKQTIRWQGEVKMIKADESWIIRSENITRTITGYRTAGMDDNILEVSGITEVKRSDKTEFSRKITETLVRIGDCKYFTDGIVQIERTGKDKYTTDYGFSKEPVAACDNWVLITRGETTKEFQLK